jgi:multidrug efflux system membrane fusion protein
MVIRGFSCYFSKAFKTIRKRYMKSAKLIAVILTIIACLWIASGLLTGPEPTAPPAEEKPASAEKKTAEVRIINSKAGTYADKVEITGRSQASRSIVMKAETSGQLAALPKEEGDKILEKDVLAQLEVRDRQARTEEAQQRVNQRQIEYNAAKRLEDKGFNSRVRLAQSLADLEAAKAELKMAQVEKGKTDILAPFEGVIANQEVEVGDYLSVGDALFTLVDLDPIEFVGFASERRVHDLSLGKEAEIELLDGARIKGILSFISPIADPQTRTFRVKISAINTDLKIKEGLTARVLIPVGDKSAHKISPSILALNDAGQIGVKIVGVDNKVAFVPIQILADEPRAMWVTGLPETARIITVGQDFVTEGQLVKPVAVNGDGLL